MEGSTLTQRAECQLKEREIQTDYMMELGARLALMWQIQREQEKEMKRIWFETRKMPSLIEENVRDVTNRPLTEFMAHCIDSLPPLAFTNRRPIPTMLHPPSPLAIRAQDDKRFIVFSYFVPVECPVATETTADVSAVFDIDYKLPGAAVEGTNKCPVASETTNDVSTQLKEDMAADQSPPDPAALPPSSPCIRDSEHKLTKEEKEDATESSVATEMTVGTSIVQGEDLDKSPDPRLPPSLSHILDSDHKQPEETKEGATKCSVAANSEDPSAATGLPSVLPSSLQLVFDNDYKRPEDAVEGTSKCPVVSEAAASVSTVLEEEFLADKSPPAPAALLLRLPCTQNIDHKQPEETVENTTECSVDTEASAVTSTVKREELTGDKSPVLALPPSLACIHDKDHKQPDQKVKGTTEEVDICPHAHQLVSDADLTATRNDELPTPLICVVTKTPVRVGASICRSEDDDEPRPWTLEEAMDCWIRLEIESEERSVKDVSPREGLKSEVDCAHSKCSNGKVSSERAETILGRVGFLVMNHMQKIPCLKMEEKEKNKKLNKKLKDDEKERKEMKHKQEEQKKREEKDEPRQRKEATSFGKPVHNDENGGVPWEGGRSVTKSTER
ncbi:uncharacterized protein LOC120050776 [Salvelinus namaycush]|uniref:Uncharacterized protein LOC120050776 n=1 Tax=Salvelinus namaycush TaxID=8040 RepID=A0A8U0R130_SALNM|nr:uncharacterized protein LOC120050776 [Salvelinus namaycush]